MNTEGLRRNAEVSSLKRYAAIAVMVIVVAMGLTQGAYAEETGCYLSANSWILRVYSQGTNPYSFSLELKDQTNNLVPLASVAAFSTAGNPCNGLNPCPVFAGAASPDVSLACDTATGTAYIFHQNGLGATVLTTIPGFVAATGGSPVLSPSPTPLDFGTARIKYYADRTLTVTNTGGAALHVSSATSSSTYFKIMSNACAGIAVAPSGTCSIVVRFTPTSNILYTGTLTINSDGGTAAVPLQGTGVY